MDLGQSKPIKSKLCFSTCKNDSGLSSILNPTQSKAAKRKLSDTAKMRRNLYFAVVLVKIFLRTNIKYIRTFVMLVIYVMYGLTTDALGFEEKINK